MTDAWPLLLWLSLGSAWTALTLFALDALIRRVRSLEMRLDELERRPSNMRRSHD